ncbi:MAG: colicin receptor TolA [Idiomarinaceae bacterium HL-53]|nr:MAG: colicin receptor TolA [Idiomarinaceae bacterium HL-53]CUS48425.1 colicin import membrane protein [Idiomarinaceae bacterium HL-53]
MSQASIGGAFFKSTLLHIVLIGGLLVSADFSPAPLHTVELSEEADEQPEIIEAVAVDQQQVQAQVERIQQAREQARREEAARVAELERRAREAQQRREREQAEARRAEQERRAQEQAAREEAERLEQARQQAEERLRQQQEEAERLEQERLEREEAERREEEAQRRRQEQERLLQEQAERERAERDRVRRERVQSEVERYQAMIRQTIQRNWLTDSSMRGKSCELRISIARDGFVTNVQVGEGDKAVCDSARAAVLRAGTLPVSEDPDVYREMSNILLRVEPNL